MEETCIPREGNQAPTIWRLGLPNGAAMVATAGVSIAGTTYVGQLGTLELAGMALVLLGLGWGPSPRLCMALGAGKLLGPVLAGTARSALVALGGMALMGQGAPINNMFALIGVAMLLYGVLTGVSF